MGWQWDEAEKWGCGKGEEKTRYTGDLGFHQREIPPKPTARQAALLWPLHSTLDFFCPELGLLQRGSWVSSWSLAARKTFWRGWKTLSWWAAVAGGEESEFRASLRCSGPGSVFHPLEKSSNYCLKPNYKWLPAQPKGVVASGWGN